ncbi:MAG: aminotransferase class I/II-fold pyridoxal phosphate-dependent enzyme [Acidobacteria bacterium]|nr:aminotransferase class I/II-fold pyridoxal phosphate-dependent enzyme [Acidobacteriota bacterium]
MSKDYQLPEPYWPTAWMRENDFYFVEREVESLGGARLISGTLPLHIQLEEQIALVKKTEAAAVFSNGYAANVAAISALVGRHDHVFCDKLNHASIVGSRQQRSSVKKPDNLSRSLLCAP